MIYLFTALMPEAKPVIERWHLKKNITEAKFPLFENEERTLRLVVTGVGQINMAMAVAHIFSRYEAGPDTYAINLGICAGNRKGAYLIQKITEESTLRTFYPDLLLCHPYEEETLLSGMTVCREQKASGLYDMEGAAFYQSAVKYIWTDRISLIKVVSDAFEPDKVSFDDIKQAIANQSDQLEQYLNQINRALSMEQEQKAVINEELLLKLSKDLCCSIAMTDQLRLLYRYLTLEGINVSEAVRPDYESGILPCKHKKEGLKYLDELKKRYL